MAIGLWAMNRRGPLFVIFRATLKITWNSAAFEASTRCATQSYQEWYSDQSHGDTISEVSPRKNLCPHRFPWPHSELHSQGYQICLLSERQTNTTGTIERPERF